MNTIRILSLALLAGVGVGGAVWYIWGVIENIGVARKLRAAHADADAASAEAGEAKKDDADSLGL